ncbi:hypothetical protein FRACA_980011 [Frankia canadensis]|uniref:Uncharacterized protein n=1 Tax=Frankia canadensis TaxID=1836972 RepID=A0A2I2L2X2_9ACTN|nr:hypothetical protein FRACA_980011 [Frankia canadensis]SOU59538.1 hypothetical protein FRACA_980011 [Frankia canadensis]
MDGFNILNLKSEQMVPRMRTEIDRSLPAGAVTRPGGPTPAPAGARDVGEDGVGAGMEGGSGAG